MARPPRLSDGAGGPRATILDVAAAAGVSRQTVTRAMNGMPGISATTKARVLAAAEALGYRPSRFGRGLVTGGALQLGLVVDDLRNPWSPELAAAVVRRAAASGWDVMLADVALSGDADRMVASLGAQTDAVIGYLGRRAAEWIGLLGTAPVVELDPAGEPLRGAVVLDHEPAVAALADHLAAVGTRAAVLLDSPGPGSPSRRARSLAAALGRRGIAVRVVADVPPTAEAAAGATARLVASPDRPDAVLAFNDLMALGVLGACRRAGLDVPGDVRVTGVDGLAVGGLVAPALTTLAVDLDAVADDALALAAAMLAGGPRSGPAARRTAQHRLLLRESA